MYTIGLIGGIASGKSTVAEMLADEGAAVLNADQVAHDVLNQDEVRDTLVAEWGKSILSNDGSINRAAVANLVFADTIDGEENRKFLESVIHPLTRRQLEQQRDQLVKQGKTVFVVDAPLLLEAGWDTTCDVVIMVQASDERRHENVARRGWSVDELERREQAQLPLATKLQRSDVVIDNSGTLAQTREQIEAFWQEFVQPRIGG